MKCPYCQSDVIDQVLACPHCTKDLYLFKPMMQRVADLEEELRAIPERQALMQRVAQLEELLTQNLLNGGEGARGTIGRTFRNVLIFLVLPFVFLIMGHGLITIVYDTKLLYLRLISIIVPSIFGYALMSSGSHKVLPWLMMSTLLAMTSVLGMSYMTHLVDGTPVMPQNAFEWREFFEYGVSISASFLTGMVLGRAAYIKHHPAIKSVIGGAYAALISKTGTEDMDAAGVLKLMRLLNEHIGTVTALGSSALSIYTGLKGILG